MRRQIALSVFVFTFVMILATAQPAVQAQTAAKQISKDEVFISLAKRINAASESPVSAIVAEIDGVIEVASIAMEADGKALVTVKERNELSAPKTTRLKFSPPASDNQWSWVEFEENRKFYPVEKIFPYAKGELEKRRQLVTGKWGAFVTGTSKQADAAFKVLDTAKAVLKTEPPPLTPFNNVRTTYLQAVKDNDSAGIVAGYRDLSQQTDSILTLGDTYGDLKTNDAYLRLLEEYKNLINLTNAARKDYVRAVESYNESLLRLPFALVAYGLQYTKLDLNLSAE
ncbi:MAG TPA: LemA family protein [Blastocatellia bacterium]|nr:LemA family protein [Blastocatellia bacterium]